MTDVSNDRETPATDPTAAADEEAAHVRPDPPDDRDLRYPPVDAAPSGHLEPLDHQLLRQALQSDGTIAEPLTTPGFHVPPPMAATPGDEGTPWPEPLVEESTVAWGEESTTMWTEPLIEQAHEESTDASDPTAGESVDEVFECLHYRDLADPAWRQRGQECTGFALAAIVNYHLRVDLGPDGWAAASPGERLARTVSRRMLYEMAQVYDREDFVEGSTLRGALKGWAQAGVAADHAWPYAPGDEHGEIHGSLTVPRSLDSAGRPGALYLRVDPNDPEAMKSALERGFPLFASAQTHGGWFDMYLPGHDAIERPDDAVLGGAHAFAIYGYDSRGWLIHNSWGPEWGDDGCARLGFDDFADAAQDVWFVFRPRRLEFVDIADQTPFESPPSRHPAGPLPASTDMWLHRVSIGDDGGLSKSGRFGMSPDELGTQLYLFRKRTRHWKRRRLAIVADPGYWDARDTLEALTPLCEQMMAEEIYPLFLVWDSPWFDGLRGWLHAEAGTDPTAFTATEPGPASDDPTGLDLDDTWSVLAKFLVAQSAAPRIWRQVHAAARTALRP
ncbi:MAG: C1 family peptidase, partial [Ilumatobacter sp.]